MIQLLSIMEGAPTGAVANCKKLMPCGHIIGFFFNSVMSHILFYFYLKLNFFLIKLQMDEHLFYFIFY